MYRKVTIISILRMTGKMQVIRKHFIVRPRILRYAQSDRKIARVVMAEILHFVQNNYTKNVIAVNAETLHFV